MQGVRTKIASKRARSFSYGSVSLSSSDYNHSSNTQIPNSPISPHSPLLVLTNQLFPSTPESAAIHQSMPSTPVSVINPPSVISDDETPEPLPIGRFNAIVDLIFDPNIVNISHRRAIINCARYVSASIDESFKKSVCTQSPLDYEFYMKFQNQYTVETGPYLAVITPAGFDDDEVTGQLLGEQSPTGSTRSTTVTPPKKLTNYMQVLLWYRCMTDLIGIFNSIQSRHVDESPNDPKHIEVVRHCDMGFGSKSCQEPASTPSKSNIYPFCCKAHSLTFGCQYPVSLIPHSVRTWFGRMVKIAQSVSQRSPSSNFIIGSGESAMPSNRCIQYVGPKKRLVFCNNGAHPITLSIAENKGLKSTDEELVQRRYQVEEQSRQDNKIKQELLGLCHMACGLFLTDGQSGSGTPTIMSLLRQGSPWNKGVWREGEWQNDAINQPPLDANEKQDCSRDIGGWQRLCIAAIQFLSQEELGWGGNRANAELSRLRASSNASTWTYYE
ncbi:hypothetical protein BGZ76_000139 [Entomortierella beljakovae]|nr:hypothetical protein BGZ76_000139 [Entomortierella beljakovae]